METTNGFNKLLDQLSKKVEQENERLNQVIDELKAENARLLRLVGSMEEKMEQVSQTQGEGEEVLRLVGQLVKAWSPRFEVLSDGVQELIRAYQRWEKEVVLNGTEETEMAQEI